MIGSLDNFLEESGLTGGDGGKALHDMARVRGLLLAAARDGRALSYAELLGRLGLRFTRPKMRAVCRTLDAIDRQARAAGELELAVLVVRESDGLPGQGWWAGRRDYAGEWTGAEARAFVARLQERAFEYWR